MAREVVWTEPARQDLEAAAEYIARGSESYAAAFVREVLGAAESLSELAERGQIVPEFRDPFIRVFMSRWDTPTDERNFFQSRAARSTV